ncbi:MAG: tetratricopeptide repeat protein [Candidatus Omnitrophica bacterium]|nr:tetratricopeptide repeat protein [Candidatus Omnitrophota bacterium]
MVAVICVCAGVACAGELLSEEATNYYNEGVRSQVRYDTVAADTAYSKVLLIAPRDMNLRKAVKNNIGVLRARAEEIDAAEENLLQSLEIDPLYKPALLNAGLLYEMKNERLKSLQYWATVYNLRELKPKDFILKEDAQIPREGGNVLLPMYQQVIPFNYKDPEFQKFILNNMGVIYIKRNDLSAAELLFKQALQLDPDYKPALLNLGLLYDGRRDKARALESWARAFDLELDKPQKYVMKDVSEGIPHPLEKGKDVAYHYAPAKDPDYQDYCMNNMGIVYANRQDLAKAEAMLEEIIRKSPKYRPALLNLGLVYDIRKDRVTALTHWAKVFDFESRKPRKYVMLDMITEGDFPYEYAPVDDPSYQKFIINNMGVILVTRKELDKAKEMCMDALTIDPSYRPARLNLGLVYDLQDERLLALELWFEAFNLNKLKPQTFLVAPEQKYIEKN